jgi:hypothetical protein
VVYHLIKKAVPIGIRRKAGLFIIAREVSPAANGLAYHRAVNRSCLFQIHLIKLMSNTWVGFQICQAQNATHSLPYGIRMPLRGNSAVRVGSRLPGTELSCLGRTRLSASEVGWPGRSSAVRVGSRLPGTELCCLGRNSAVRNGAQLPGTELGCPERSSASWDGT